MAADTTHVTESIHVKIRSRDADSAPSVHVSSLRATKGRNMVLTRKKRRARALSAEMIPPPIPEYAFPSAAAAETENVLRDAVRRDLEEADEVFEAWRHRNLTSKRVTVREHRVLGLAAGIFHRSWLWFF